MAEYPDSVRDLIEKFGRLPGVGTKTAERLAYHILKTNSTEALELAEAIRRVKQDTAPCSVCGNFTETDPCPICSDPQRDAAVIAVVEDPRDMAAIERAGGYRGVYHVLGGRISPLDGVRAGDLNIDKLLERVGRGGAREVIIATNPDMEGDGTAMYLLDALRQANVRITRLARGIPAGQEIQYASTAVISEAFSQRREA